MRRSEQHAQQPPTAAQLIHLKPSNAAGGLLIAGCFALTVAALWLSVRGNTWMWLIGQVLLALALEGGRVKNDTVRVSNCVFRATAVLGLRLWTRLQPNHV